MGQLRGPAGSAFSKIALLEQKGGVAARGGIDGLRTLFRDPGSQVAFFGMREEAEWLAAVRAAVARLRGEAEADNTPCCYRAGSWYVHPLEEELHRRREQAREFMELARGNAVRALLVFLDLLECEAEGFRHFGLAFAGLKPSGTHAGANVLVDEGGISGHS